MTKFFVGTFTQKDGRTIGKAEGIYLVETDQEGSMKLLSISAKIPSPAYLILSHDGKHLYSVSREEKNSHLFAFEILENNNLKLLNSIPTGFRSLCHISISWDGKFLFTTNYIGGCLTMFHRKNSGEIEFCDKSIIEGGGPVRDQAHIHSSVLSKNNKTLFAADLGSDKIWIFTIDQNHKKLIPNEPKSFFRCRPSSGPRMMKFLEFENEQYILCANQIDCSVSLFQINKEENDLTELDFKSTLPENFDRKNNPKTTASDCQIHPNKRFVYISNRGGHNSISGFEIVDKKLKFIQNISSQGIVPRGFTISKCGKFCFVGNQDTDNIFSFQIDQDSGKLTYDGKKLDIKTPVCMVWL